MMARTRRMWIKPPAVPVTSPNSHKIIRIIAMVYNINFLSYVSVSPAGEFAPAGKKLIV
jgi:hypothetical protein